MGKSLKVNVVLILAISMLCYKMGAAQTEYQIQVNDSVYDINLDQKMQVTIGGEKVNLLIRQNDTLLYESDLFSFSYPSEYKVSEMELDHGISQCMVITVAGGGYLVQEYQSISPKAVEELMLNELTKESLDYGYSMSREDYNKTLPSGVELEVK